MSSLSRAISLFLLTLSFPGLFPAGLARGQGISPSTVSATGAIVRLKGTVHPLAVSRYDAGRVDATRTLHRMVLLLAPDAAKQEALEAYLAELQDPHSAKYHRWLTPEEFATKFGANDTDVTSVTSWLQQSGLTVGQVSRSRSWIEFSGAAGRVESAFGTQLRYFRVGESTYLANATELTLPSSIARVTRGLVSLNNFGRKPPRLAAQARTGTNTATSPVRYPQLTASGQSNTYYLAPGDFSAIYNTAPLLSGGIDGTGVSIAIAAQSQIELTDVQMFRRMFVSGTPNDPNVYFSGPDPGITQPEDVQEAMLDVEWASAIAPGATINLVIAGSTDTTGGVDLAAAYAVDQRVSPILVFTYGACEAALGSGGNAFYNALWQQAAAEGITVLVAAGDNGSAGCDSDESGLPSAQGLAVNGAASTPYNVAVGGTQFNDTADQSTYWNGGNSATFASAMGYIPESAWNESCDPSQAASATNCLFQSGSWASLAGSGGVSTLYEKPAWQSGAGVPEDGMRDLPDLALASASGHDDIVYCLKSDQNVCQISNGYAVGMTLAGGTSAAAPAMAGILALVEQKNGAFQGQINPILYQLAQTRSCNASEQTNPTLQTTCVFYDVTSGSNAVPCAGGSPDCSSTQSGVNGYLSGYAAGAGYDLATGLGSLNAANLSDAWGGVSFAGSQTSLQADNNSFTHGAPVTLSGRVTASSGAGTPTGQVALLTNSQFSAGTLPLTEGGYSASLANLPGGQYRLWAHYAGDTGFAASDSPEIVFNVLPEASTTTLCVNPPNTTVNYGDPLALKASVAGNSGAGTATGSVTLREGGVALGTFPLASDGSAFLITNATPGGLKSLAPGAHSLTADYSGDASFLASSSAALNVTIGKGYPFLVVGLNSNTVSSGQPVAAHVVVSGFGSALATGAVQFTVDGTPYGAAQTLQSGGFFGMQAQASLVLTNLPQGTHAIGANYDGSADPNYLSVSAGDRVNELTQTLTVGGNSGAATTTTLSSLATPGTMGDMASFKVSVTPASATGSVVLWDAVGPRSSAFPISGGSAQVNIVWPQAGTASVYAVYSGDSTNASSASPAVSFTVNRAGPQVTLSGPNTSSPGQQITFNVVVTGTSRNGSLAQPGGLIEFWDSANGAAAQLLSVQSLTGGPANTSVYALRTALSAGPHVLKVHYRGDTNWLPADSSPISLNEADFTISALPDPMVFTDGTPGTTTITVTPQGGFTGQVALTCGTGTSQLPAGYTCTLNPSTVTVSSGAATSVLTLSPTSAATAGIHAAERESRERMALFAAFLIFGLGLLGAGVSRAGRSAYFAAGVMLCAAGMVVGCGGGGGGPSGPVPSTTVLTTTNNRVTYQTPLTFTASVSASTSPSGSVQLYDNGVAYGGPTPVSAGNASFFTLSLPIGFHTLKAVYSGDANTQGSTSAPITQQVLGSLPLQVTGSAGGDLSHAVNFTVVVN